MKSIISRFKGSTLPRHIKNNLQFLYVLVHSCAIYISTRIRELKFSVSKNSDEDFSAGCAARMIFNSSV